MQRLLFVLFCGMSLAAAGRAQDRKIEISPFAGGYFNTGYQAFGSVVPLVSPFLSFTPISFVGSGATAGREPNGGIFGVRASHALTSSLALEGTFAFSPTGTRFQEETRYSYSLDDPLSGTDLPIPRVSAGETFHYAANLVYEISNRRGWAPFFTAGAGAITRTESKPSRVFVDGPSFLDPNDTTVTVHIPTPEAQTNLSVNLGGGVKKYLTDRYGIRFDFRSYISQPGGDTVNNMELSFGLIFRL